MHLALGPIFLLLGMFLVGLITVTGRLAKTIRIETDLDGATADLPIYGVVTARP